MKKKYIITISLILIRFFLFSNDNTNDINDNLQYNKYLTISKFTRNIAIGFLSPGILITSSFVPFYLYKDYLFDKYNYYNDYYNNTNDITAKKYASDSLNIYNALHSISWAILSFGVAFDLSSIILAIISSIYDQKAINIKNKNSILSNPNKFDIWPLYKTLNAYGITLTINGTFILIFTMCASITYNYWKNYTSLDVGRIERFYVAMIFGLVTGATIDLTGIIFFIVAGVNKKNLTNNKSNIKISFIVRIGN